MSIYQVYRDTREYWGALALLIMIVAFVMSFGKPSSITQAQQESFLYNLALFATAIWFCLSATGKVIMMRNAQAKKQINLLALVMLGVVYLLANLAPGSEETAMYSGQYSLYYTLLSVGLYSWIFLDFCEALS